MGAVVAWDCANEEYREMAYNAMAVEIDALKHDIERHLSITSEQAAEIEQMRTALQLAKPIIVRSCDEQTIAALDAALGE